MKFIIFIRQIDMGIYPEIEISMRKNKMAFKSLKTTILFHI